MNAVEISNVTKSFDAVTAVNNLSLAIPEGAIYGFIGPNGSGKSTTMRMITNIYYPDSGTIRVFGERRRGVGSGDVGYLPEERGLYRQMKIRELLEFYGELRGGKNVTAQVNDWLKRLDLDKWAEEKVQSLSKGMSQKVQFIATVVPEPRLLILDEPFTGLDPVSGDLLRNAVLEMKRRGATIILSTHDMNTAAQLCDYIFMIYRGNKVLDGTLTEIQSQYPSDTLHISMDATGDALLNLPGITSVRDYGRLHELHMAPGCDPQQVLRALLERGDVRSFSVVQPSLHDIFVRIAGPAAALDAEQAA